MDKAEQTHTTIELPKRSRLKFIDMARSIAILLMLEGHFVDLTLNPIYRKMEYPAYQIWLFIRGFTAPTFLTVTGLVFIFLMLKASKKPEVLQLRTNKGFKRVAELFFWGYLLQYYAFHVLECIATGILFIILIYKLYKLIKIVPLWIYYFTLGTLLFGFNLYLSQLPSGYPWPENAPYFIQNMFHAPSHRAIFPITPWMGFTMYGAMFGSILYTYQDKIKSLKTPIFVICFGLLFFFGIKYFLRYINEVTGGPFAVSIESLDWLYIKLGMVIIVLGTLMLIENLIGEIRNSLFLKIGQNTLTIFIIHMMILYGSVIRIGVNDFYKLNLDPWPVVFGAVLLIASFAFLILYIDYIKQKLDFILAPIQKIMYSIFRIKA
jgi:uncharacterized membrane protein